MLAKVRVFFRRPLEAEAVTGYRVSLLGLVEVSCLAEWTWASSEAVTSALSRRSQTARLS